MKSENFQIAILTMGTVFLLASLFTTLKVQDNLKAYNKRMCAVYGYEEDCKTILPVSERLK